MATLKLTGFSGEIPKFLPRLLPDMSAQVASNTRLTNGGLEPIRVPRQITVIDPPLADDEATIYRHNNAWLGWPGLVHAAPGPVDQDRLYYTGDGVPKMRIDLDIYPLAVEAPTDKLSGSVSGTGDGDTVTRLYVYTFVTDFGEETAPSPISDPIEWEPGQTVTLSGFQAGDASRDVSKQRIYRSQTGQGGTELYFIAERATTTSDFTDDIAVDDFAEPIPTTQFATPPDDLAGLTAMPNGMMAAFRGKEVWFCEPYQPHAWPEVYILTTDYPIVGLGAFGSSLAVLTEGNPYIASGSSPDSMVMEKLELNLPCINARGIVDLGYAVAYPSHDGLVVASQGGARVASESLFSRDDWQGFNPGQFAAGQYDGRYYASYIYVDESLEERRGTLIIDLSGQQPFIIRTNIETRAFYYNIETGSLYYLKDNTVFQWDAPGAVNATQEWHSKEFVLPRPTNFGAILIEVDTNLTLVQKQALSDEVDVVQAERDAIFDSEDSIGGEVNGAAVNEVMVNGDSLPIVPNIARDLTVNVWADGVLRAAVSKTQRMARLPSGFKARKWEIEVVGDQPVEQITLATSGAELMGV